MNTRWHRKYGYKRTRKGAQWCAGIRPRGALESSISPADHIARGNVPGGWLHWEGGSSEIEFRRRRNQ